MEKIKLPTALANAVWKNLEKKGVQPRKNLANFYDEKFTQDELDKVTDVELVNYCEGFQNISYLRNLKYLSIDNTQTVEYTAKRDLYSLKDEDIWELEKLENLQHLSINKQKEISQIDISGFKNLQSLSITRCENLQEIIGLENNRTLIELTLFEMNSLSKIKKFDEFIEQNQNLQNLELDVLLYPSAIGYRSNGQFNKKASDKLDSLEFIKWSESVTDKKTSINHFQMKKMHKKAIEIVEKYCTSSHDLEKVVAVNEYIARNITYNYDALNNSFRGIIKNGLAAGSSNGANGAYDGLINNSCVCEGYTRVMQYLLTLVGIKTANTHCVAGEDKYGFAEKGKADNIFITLPKEGFHSICRIERESGIYYCDSCWNAGRYQKGDKSMPWLLLTKEQIAKTHTLSYNEQNVAHQKPIPIEVVERAKQVVSKSFETNLNV